MIVSATPVLTALAALCYGFLALRGTRLSPAGLRASLVLAALLHGGVLLLSYLFIQPAYFGFAPALSITAWLVLIVYIAESRLLPQLRARVALAWLGMATVVMAYLFPGSPTALPATTALDVHIALGLTAYALFACAVLHAGLMQHAEAQLRHPKSSGLLTGDLPVLTLERLMFAFVFAGFVVLTASFAAALFFPDNALPSAAFRWSHKVIFAILAWLTFVVLLAGHRWLGWRGRKAVRMVYIGAAFLLLSYVGSHFVLEVLLKRGAA